MIKNYTRKQIEALARRMVNSGTTFCLTDPICGCNGEKNYCGQSFEEVAKKNNISLDEARLVAFDSSATTYDNLSRYWQERVFAEAKNNIMLLAHFRNKDQNNFSAVRGMYRIADYATQMKYVKTFHKAWLGHPANRWALNTPLNTRFEQLSKFDQEKFARLFNSICAWSDNPDI